MKTRSRGVRVLGLAVIATLVVSAILVPAAFATGVRGDSESNAVTLTIGASMAGTLTTAPASPAEYLFVYSIRLNAGQTIVATYTTSPAITHPDMLAWASFPTDVAWLGSHWHSQTVRVTHLLAPRTGKYYLAAFGQSVPGTFTVTTTLTAPISYSLWKVGAPKSARRNRSFKVVTTLAGQFDELNIPVRFVVTRRSGGVWKAYRTIKPGFSRTNASHTLMSTNLKLPAGTFRIRARFIDAAHPKPLYDAWRNVIVK